MFGSVPDGGHESSGISVPVLIPWSFVWRNGGRSVSVCGSFTRCVAKYDHILMFMLIPRSEFFMLLILLKVFDLLVINICLYLFLFGCDFSI